MSKTTKSQFYRYSMRSVCATDVQFCTKRIMMELYPPDEALSIENLFCHIRITFDNTLPTADKVLHRIGIISDYTTYSEQDQASYFRYLDIDRVAIDDVIDMRIDLTSLLNKENVGTIGDAGVFTDGTATIVFLEGANAFSTSDNNVGTINIWKLDGTYTTQKIR